MLIAFQTICKVNIKRARMQYARAFFYANYPFRAKNLRKLPFNVNLYTKKVPSRALFFSLLSSFCKPTLLRATLCIALWGHILVEGNAKIRRHGAGTPKGRYTMPIMGLHQSSIVAQTVAKITNHNPRLLTSIL